MEKQKKKLTKEQLEAIKVAVKEKRFSATDLIKEIQPLLEEYFLGKFTFEENALCCEFPNGQKIKIIAV